MFNRILVPTDFSPPSDSALEHARILATKFGSSLRLLHVIDEPNASSAFVADGFAPNTESIREGMLLQARERLAQVMKVAERAHIHVTADAVVGTPASAIVDFAAATGTSLIVMGTHGRTGLAHLLMGSVAEHVVRTATCPVLGASGHRGRGGHRCRDRVLCADSSVAASDQGTNTTTAFVRCSNSEATRPGDPASRPITTTPALALN